MHVFHRVTNAELISEGVLCPVNMHLDGSGIFDLPQETLKRVVGDVRIKPPGPDAPKADVVMYATKFNRDVMGHDLVVRFLAERISRNLDALGKTIVFVPRIEIANRLVAALAAYPRCAGHVAAVHNRMSEVAHAVPGQQARTPEEVLDRFKRRGAEPCVLVNVEMLTEGFDDPKVRSVVLAKLTLSTNRFWQMIGRGTRGHRCGGTTDCNVIDPIKLVRLYNYFAGYQPSIASKPGTSIEDEAEEIGPGALDPSVPAVSVPPLPTMVTYSISEELRRTHAQVAAALDAFLAGEPIGEQEAVNIVHDARVSTEDGAVVVKPANGVSSQAMSAVIPWTIIERMSTRMNADLGWLQRQFPTTVPDDVLRFWMRKLNAVEKLCLRTEEAYARAEMDGSLARELAIPVAPPDRGAVPAAVPAVVAPDSEEADVSALCARIARADGVLVPVEVEVAVRVIARTGVSRSTPQLHERVAALSPSASEAQGATLRLAQTLSANERRSLLRGLVEIAAADGFVHPDEVGAIGAIADGFGVARDYIEALVDARAE